MTISTVTIDSSITNIWSGASLGCIAYSVEITQNNQRLWEYYESSIAVPLQQKLTGTDLVNMPQIGESRAAYKAFGIAPGRHRISSEALYRRVRQGKALYQINSLVDVNNVVSLETGYSLGSYDTSHVGPDIIFRLGLPGEVYSGIGKADIVLENMPLLADGAGPFGSPTSDSIRGMITSGTREGLTVIYSFSGRNFLKSALEQTEWLFSRFAHITATRAFIV